MKLKFFSLLIALATFCTSWAGTPKYIFYFIGDGMGMGHIMSTETYNRTVLGNSNPILMMQFPVASLAMTYSYSSPVTDSAAAGTALSTGHKTRNYMLGMGPDTIPVYSIAKSFKENGYGVAITTTVAPDDATPGSFYTHVPNRSMYYEIGMDMARSGYDFFAGSHLRGLKDKEGKETDLLPTLTKNGYQVAYGVDEIDKASKKVVLLAPKKSFNGYQCGYTIDSVPGALTLPQITKAALDHLTKVSPDKFFMMVEGGNIDWAAHANDGGAVVKEILNFNQAIKIAYDFYLAHPDETLIVITADHDTGGMTIGVSKGPKIVNFKNIDFQRISKDVFAERCAAQLKSKRIYRWEDAKEELTSLFGLYKEVAVSEAQDKRLQEAFDLEYVQRASRDNKTLYATFTGFAETVFDVLQHISGFGWTTNSHTGNPVPVFAVGAGSEKFSKISNNIEIPHRIADAADVEFDK